MNLGAEPKRVAILGALVLAGGYFFYSNVLSDSDSGPRPSARKDGALAARNSEVGAALNPQSAARSFPHPRPSRRRSSRRAFIGCSTYGVREQADCGSPARLVRRSSC